MSPQRSSSATAATPRGQLDVLAELPESQHNALECVVGIYPHAHVVLSRSRIAADWTRLYSLRLHEVGMIESSPNTLIAEGTDWRFLNELKRELKE